MAFCSWKSQGCGKWISHTHEAMGGHPQVQSSLLPSHFLSSNTQTQASLLFGFRRSSSPKNRHVTPLSLTQILWTVFAPLRAVVLWSTSERAEGKGNTPQISRLVLCDDPPHGDGFCENTTVCDLDHSSWRTEGRGGLWHKNMLSEDQPTKGRARGD